MQQKPKIYLDVRTEEEFQDENVPGSINVPLQELLFKIDSLPKESQIIVFCMSGARAMAAVQILLQNGFTDVVCAGSWQSVNIE